MKFDVYQHVTDTICEMLESGTAPWRKPWAGNNAAACEMPRNATTGRPYSGVNVLLLWARAARAGYATSQWATYKQANAAGGQVRKGEKGTTVVFFKFIEDKKDPKKRIPMARSFTVFNLDQIDGLDHLREQPVTPVEPSDFARIAEVDHWVLSQGATIKVSDLDRAFYQPGKDFIHIPRTEQFASQHGYYGTLLHELVHWTGHESRTDRRDGMAGRFGDEAYAMEELVAELGAAFLGAQFGIDPNNTRDGIEQHASYIKSWVKKLREDKKAIFTASSKAQAAVEWLHTNAAANVDQMAA